MGKTGKMLNLDSLKLDKDKWPVKWYLPFLLAIPLIGATVSISFGSTPIFDDPRHTELRNRALNDDGESQYRLGFLYKEGGFPRISAKNDNEYWEAFKQRHLAKSSELRQAQWLWEQDTAANDRKVERTLLPLAHSGNVYAQSTSSPKTP